MREIKFRAWDKKYKEMIKDIWIAPEYSWSVMSDNDALCERERAEREQIELMQYTGLKDKNGTEIYEGDIVEYDFYYSEFNYEGGTGYEDWSRKRNEVIWEENIPGFSIDGELPIQFTLNYHESMKEEYRSIDADYKFKGLIVIGNVYENPELLKESK